jgi:hypothetical protein
MNFKSVVKNGDGKIIIILVEIWEGKNIKWMGKRFDALEKMVFN